MLNGANGHWNQLIAKKVILCCSLILSMQISTAQNFDINSLKTIHLNRNKNLDPTFQQISNTMYYLPFVQTGALYTVGLIKKNKKHQSLAIEQAIAMSVNGFATYTLKHSFNRPRPVVTYPFLQPLEPLTQYSFPSGHTSMGFYNATIWSLQCKKWYVTAPSFLLASSVAYSRMHLGVHYPTDVIAGAFTGATSAFIGQRINQYLQRNKKTKKYYNKILW
jgi:membrane-associated phospholipid phosphatase